MTRRIIFAAETRRKFGDISNTTMHRYMAAGVIPPSFKLGRANAWFEDDIDAALSALSQKEAA